MTNGKFSSIIKICKKADEEDNINDGASVMLKTLNKFFNSKRQPMDSAKEDKYGMFLKMESFLTDRATTLSINPAYADILLALTANDNDITQADSTASRDLSGLTEIKSEKRVLLETSILTVAGATRGYYTANPDPYQKKIVVLTSTAVDREQDTNLISLADKVHDVANPVKTLLAPWGVTAAMVDGLLTLVNEYRPTIVKRSREQDVSVVANVQVTKLFAKNDELLKEFDDHFAVYEFTDNNLYLEGRLARAIDDSGDNSSTDGYNVQNIVVPAGGSLFFSFGEEPPMPTTEIYLHAINGSVIVCSTDLPASPCASGYNLVQAVTFKGQLIELGIDLNKTHFQMTNPGLTNVTVRVGKKIV